MSKDGLKSSGNGLENLFVPFIEVIAESMQRGVEYSSLKLAASFNKGFSKKSEINKYHPLNVAQLKDENQYHKEGYLGWSINYNRPFPLKYFDPSKHVFLIGASGWGKTNLINLLIENALNNKQSLIFIDPKGSVESISDFKSVCLKFNRRFAIFSEYDKDAVSFNPIKDMTNTQRISMIMRSFDWGDKPNQYYLNQSALALSEVLEKLTATNIEIDLFDILKELKTNFNTEETSGLITQLHLILTSDFGKCFKKGLNKGHPSISMMSAYNEKVCVYIGCSTQGYGAIARTVGKMFVSEAMNLSYTIGKTKSSKEAMENGIGLFIDEAGSVLFPDFIDLVNKCRSSGINIYTAVQSYSDMEMVAGSETLMKQFFESYSTWFIQRQTNPENADKLAAAFGTYLSLKTTTATDQGSDSGRGSIREAYEYYCHPDMLKNINVGQTILLSHSPKEIALINVRNMKLKINNEEVPKSNLASVSEQYIDKNKKKLKGAMNV